MKKLLLTLTFIISIFAFSSCAKTIHGPIDATSNPVGTKVGYSQTSYLNFPIIGTIANMSNDNNVSIYAAAKQGGITKISTVEYQVCPQGWYTVVRTIVTGE